MKTVSSKLLVASLVALSFAALVLINLQFHLYEMYGGDWRSYFYPATTMFRNGQYPYGLGVYNPPWIFLILMPLTLLSVHMGTACSFALSILGYGYAALKFGARPWQVVLFLLSPWVLINSLVANIDWMVALGFVLPPQIGLFFVLLKPQLGMAVVIFWAAEIWRTNGFWNVIKTFTPVIACIGISVLIYGFWWQTTDDLVVEFWNTSLWPLGIVLGLGFLAESLHIRKVDSAIIASPFLATYVSPMGWAIALFGTLGNPWVFTACWIGVWVIQISGLASLQ